MTKKRYAIRLPDGSGLSQGEEYFFLNINGNERLVRLHDYQTIYQFPLLYETVLYDILGCQTPSKICDILNGVLNRSLVTRRQLHMLEIGAGSGIFAEYLRDRVGITDVSGLDIYEIARIAAERDRPGVYKNYYVADLTDLSPGLLRELVAQKFNCVGVASATGWGNHIPVEGFEQAFSLLVPGGLFIFHVKPNDPDIECTELNRWIMSKIESGRLELMHKELSFHRNDIEGKPIYYDIIVGTKQLGPFPL